MECPNCRYVTAPGESVEGACPQCKKQPEMGQPSPTNSDCQAFGMPQPGQDDHNQGNPLGLISRDIQPPLGFVAKKDEDDDDIIEVDVIKKKDLPKDRDDRDLDSIEKKSIVQDNPVGLTEIPEDAEDGDSKQHSDGDRDL